MTVSETDSIVFIVNEGPDPFGADFRIRRCITLLQRLREGHRVCFLAPATWREEIEKEGGHYLETDFDDMRSCAYSLERLSAKVAVFDMAAVPLELVLLLRGLGTLIIALDDGSSLDSYVDIRINPTRRGEGADFSGLRYWVPDLTLCRNASGERERGATPFVFVMSRDVRGEISGVRDLISLLRERGYPSLLFLPGSIGQSGEAEEMITDLEAGRGAIQKAGLVVNVGLPGLFDLIPFQRPLACLRRTEEEGELLNRLLPEGAIFDLGCLEEESGDRVCSQMIQILQEPETLEYHMALAAEKVHLDNIEEVCDIVNVVKILPWDTGFFGFPVAFLSSLKLNPAIMRFVLDFCAKHKVRLLEYQCDCHDRESVQWAERTGFTFTDIRMTFERFISRDLKIPELPKHFVFDTARKGDGDRMMEIADGLYRDSRYYFDANFPRDKVRRFYMDWARKAVSAEFDDCAMILRERRDPVAFCTVKFEPNHNTARIRLVGIDSRYHARGMGLILVLHTLKTMAERGVRYVQVTTQGRNYGAQRLYQKAGFVTKKTEIWYHKWFEVGELSYS